MPEPETAAATVPVYDPRGVVSATPRPIAPRPARLDGLRLAVLDNTKWNGNKLLRSVTAALQAELPLASVDTYRKESFSKPAAPELIAEIAEKSDIVVTAIGD
jgi:hypothetical protein